MAASEVWAILLVVLLYFEGVDSLHWTEGSTPPNNSIIPACLGQDVTLSWDYVKSPDEHIVDVEWRYRRDDGSAEEVLATQVNGNFFSDPSVTQRLQYIPGAGIRLLGVTQAYTGTYLVQVNLNVNGNIQTHTQFVKVMVTDEPIATTGQLEAHFQGARYLPNTQQHQLVLKCGTFNTLWVPGVDVVWHTPDGHTLPSSTKEGGQFILYVPNPFETGEYSCHINPSSPATLCFNEESPLVGGATVIVNQTEGRVALLDSELQLVQQQMTAMSGQLQHLVQNSTDLTQQVTHVLQGVDITHLNVTGTLAPLVRGSQQIRLAGGKSVNDGRVELLVNGQWGTVCDDHWTLTEATVVCSELGYTDGHIRAYTSGGGSGSIWLDEVRCTGTESSLLDCSHLAIGTNNCNHNEDAAVTC